MKLYKNFEVKKLIFKHVIIAKT